MKKVRFMLVAIALLAVVGGALAFKASKMYTLDLCTTTPLNGTCGNAALGESITCEIFEDNVKFTNDPFRPFVCTTTANAGGHINDKCRVSPSGDFKPCTTVAPTKITVE